MKMTRKFLLPLTALIGIVATTGNTFASTNKNETVGSKIQANTESVGTTISDSTAVGEHDPLKFVIIKNKTGMKTPIEVSDHYSHGSHGSHSSHSSGQ